MEPAGPAPVTPTAEPPPRDAVSSVQVVVPPPSPNVSCREARAPRQEDADCPYFDECTITDSQGEIRASFHAQVAWWHPVTGDRLVIALRTGRDPDTGQTRAISPGDAPQELLEVTLPADGDPAWRLLGRARRGDMTCALSDDTSRAACVAVHVQRGMIWAWLLDLRGEQIAVTEAQVDREGTEVIPDLALRFHEGQFQVQIGGPEPGNEPRWVSIEPARP